MVIMQRSTGRVDFNHSMEEYEFGFGDLTGEFWYGLKNIHCMPLRKRATGAENRDWEWDFTIHRVGLPDLSSKLCTFLYLAHWRWSWNGGYK